MSNIPATDNTHEIIALVNFDEATCQVISACNFGGRQLEGFKNNIDLITRWEKQKLNIVAVISQSEILGPTGIPLKEILNKKDLNTAAFFLVCHYFNDNIRLLALRAGIADAFTVPLKKAHIETRVNFLINNRAEFRNSSSTRIYKPYKTPLIKRIFDIVFAGTVILLLSPVLLMIYLLIRLESKGPVFYYSLRVGSGYRVFKFFKFRSMYVDADKRLKDLKHLNQYAVDSGMIESTAKADTDEYLCDECQRAGSKCQFPVYTDKNKWCERDYLGFKKAKAGSAFFKLKDDPRITRVGKFIRNTSIDELPQLWNVIIGDMSIVGNRPLPLYEAEKLTTDKYALRFMAPAGITGLWQVEKRGKGEMSEEERLILDNTYARNHSFIYDIKLILKTIPALFQKESV